MRAKSANMNGYWMSFVGKREINLLAPEQRADDTNIFLKFRHLWPAGVLAYAWPFYPCQGR